MNLTMEDDEKQKKNSVPYYAKWIEILLKKLAF